MRWSKNWYLKFALLKNEEGGSFRFFFLNLAKNRVLGIFCFFEIVRKVLEREWVIVKFKNILKLTSNFNSHIIKKTFGLIYSFLRGIDWGNLQNYSFIKITNNILLKKPIWIHSSIFFCYCRGWQSWFVLFFRKKIVVNFIIILSLVLKDSLKRTLIVLKNFSSHDNFFLFSI